MNTLDSVAQDLATMEADTVQWAADLRKVSIWAAWDIESAADGMSDRLRYMVNTVACAYEDAALDTDVAVQLAEGAGKLAEALEGMSSCESTVRQSIHEALAATAHGLTKELGGLRETLAEDRQEWEAKADARAVADRKELESDYARSRGV